MGEDDGVKRKKNCESKEGKKNKKVKEKWKIILREVKKKGER